MLRRLMPLAVVFALAVPTTAAAATVKFSGKGAHFKVAHGKVKDFAVTVFLVCGDGDNGFNAVIPPKPLRIKGGKFSYKGRDRLDSTNIEIKGRIKGKKASGTVRMTDSHYSVSDQQFYPCTSGTKKWKASRR